MGLLNSDKFSPYLFIGLGGSGGRVVNALANKLRRHPNRQKMRNLVSFVAIDTNTNDLKALKGIPEANQFLISAFDRTEYIARKRGLRELDEDRLVTTWVHDDYKFRATQGDGAGQIRIESRLGFYYNLENDRAGVRKALQSMVDEATQRSNLAHLDSENRVVNCIIYGSLAGGTGSGAFLSMAYLMQDIVREHGWGRPNVVGHLMLPGVFSNKVEQVLHDDINANTYAALKELEHLTRLGYEGLQEEEEFVYDPTRPSRTTVYTRPFSLAYLIDKPAKLSIDRYTAAIADSSYLQIFSPILGAQVGEYDNYDKHQKSLALGHFAVHYGSYGTSVLVFPKDDVLDYSTIRYVARAFQKYMIFGDDPQFAVPYDEEKFQRLEPQDQNRLIDDMYVRWVDHSARLEEEQGFRGVFTGIKEMKAAQHDSLMELFQRKMAAVFDGLDELIVIEPFDDTQVNEQSISLNRSIENLRRDISDSRTRVMGTYLQSQLTDLRTDRFLGGFFTDHKVDPLKQRYFLVRLKQLGRLGPLEDAEDSAHLFEMTSNSADLDSEPTRREVSDLERQLGASLKKGLLSSLSSGNAKLIAAKRKVSDFFGRIEDDNRTWLKVAFWQAFHDELQSVLEARRSSFRDVSRVAVERTENILARAERFQADPAAVSEEAKSTEYYLNQEVFKDERTDQRLWGRFFRHRLDRHENYDEAKVFEVITQAFKPKEEDGRIRRKDANEIVEDVREELHMLGRQTFETAMADMQDLDLPGALRLEARYILAGPDVVDDTALKAVDVDDVDAYVREKLKRAVDQCVLIANIDTIKQNDSAVVSNQIFYVAMSSRYQSATDESLGSVLSKVAPRLKFIDNWEDDDMVVFYRASLGVPVYFYSRVAGELRESYDRVRKKKNRSYPLHIQKNWESLPNLDPIEVREAEERRQREEAAAKDREIRDEGIWSFSMSLLLGNIVHDDRGYAWALEGAGQQLAANRSDAFSQFLVLDPIVRDQLKKRVGDAVELRTTTRRDRAALAEELKVHLSAVTRRYLKAVQDDEERERHFLGEEQTVLERKIGELTA